MSIGRQYQQLLPLSSQRFSRCSLSIRVARPLKLWYNLQKIAQQRPSLFLLITLLRLVRRQLQILLYLYQIMENRNFFKSIRIGTDENYIICHFINPYKKTSSYKYRFLSSDGVNLFEIHSDTQLNSRFISLILSLTYYGN